MKTNAVLLKSFGTPTDSLEIQSTTAPDLTDHDVLVQMLASPVHPSDLNVIEGKYGALPTLPATPGNEGAGWVIAVGGAVTRVKPGDLVAILSPGNWCSARVVLESDVVALPAGLDPVQASMLVINPLTAWAMLHVHGTPTPGAWITQNAANSAVGQSVIQIARRLKVKSLNLVRRPELLGPLAALGADGVFADDASFADAARHLAANERPRIALNAVGGASALALANVLADGGELITYGAMARQPLKIPNGLLIFRNLAFRGFWLRLWLRDTPPETRDAAIQKLADFMLDGSLRLPVHQTLPLEEFQTAIATANSSNRDGKVILTMRKIPASASIPDQLAQNKILHTTKAIP